MRTIRTAATFGSSIRRARKERGLTQAQLAHRAGVSRSWLSELENGKRTAELGRALVVLDALGLAISFVPTPTSTSNPVDLDQLQLTTPMGAGVAALARQLSGPAALAAAASSATGSISRALVFDAADSLAAAVGAGEWKSWLPAGVFGPGLLTQLANASFDPGDTDERDEGPEDDIEDHT